MDQSISKLTKMSTQSNQEFSKFKGEYFSICEQIINKDISFLKMAQVQQQSQKLANLVEKLENVHSNSSNIAQDL